jgi:hypothetical protein
MCGWLAADPMDTKSEQIIVCIVSGIRRPIRLSVALFEEKVTNLLISISTLLYAKHKNLWITVNIN